MQMDAIAKKDKTFADKLNKEAKQLKAAGMAAEAKALEREAQGYSKHLIRSALCSVLVPLWIPCTLGQEAPSF